MRKTSKYCPRLPRFSKNPSIKRGIQNAGHNNNLWKYTLVEKVLIYKYKVHSNRLILFNHIVKRDRKNEDHSNIQQDWRKSVRMMMMMMKSSVIYARLLWRGLILGYNCWGGEENDYNTQTVRNISYRFTNTGFPEATPAVRDE